MDTASYSPSIAIIDTACQKAAAGGEALDAHAGRHDLSVREHPSEQVFRGIDPKAPLRAVSLTEIPAGIGGTGCVLKFQRLPRDVPMFMSLEQMRELDMTIHVCRQTVDIL